MIHLLQGHSCSDREVSDKPNDGTHFRPDERGFFIWWQYRARGAYAFVPSLIQGGARWNRGSRRHSALSSAFLTQLSVDAVQRSPVVMEVNRGSLAKFLTRENSLCSLLRPSRDSRERKKRKERKKKKKIPSSITTVLCYAQFHDWTSRFRECEISWAYSRGSTGTVVYVLAARFNISYE